MKIAFVVQRCGKEVIGGAESLCLQLAQRLSKHLEIEILTTRALDYATWQDHYPSGVEEIYGVKIRRFSVAKTRDMRSFEQHCIKYDKLFLNHRKKFNSIPIEDQKRWLDEQGPISDQLLDYVKLHKDEFDVFIFFGYLYATTHLILPVVREKAILMPLSHDEWPMHLTVWDEWFSIPKSFIFNTIEEKAFTINRFSHVSISGPVIGIGLEPPLAVDPERFRKKYNISGPFMLYVGRVDNLKGCWHLFKDFTRLKKFYWTFIEKFLNAIRCRFTVSCWSTWRKWYLVYVGKIVSIPPDRRDFMKLGVCDEQTKWDALAACNFLVLPSEFESLSIVILEAWMVKKPVLVNAKCAVTIGQCKRSGGGLGYKDFSDFVFSLEKLTNADINKKLGENGYHFVMANYTWPVIEKKFLEALEPFRKG